MTGTIAPPRKPAKRRDDDHGREDPRIAERRAGVRSAARRRRRIVLAVVGALVLLSAAVVGLLRSPLLDVDRIQVAGSNQVDRAEVVRASGVGVGDPLVDVDLAAARRAVMALPGVASARVERDWPGTIRISVTDEVALAVVVADERRTVVARGGRVLGPAAGEDVEDGVAADGLPEVRVEDPSLVAGLEPGASVPEPLAATLVVVEQLPRQLSSRLGAVEVSDGGSLRFVLADEAGVVEFGRPEEVPAKLLSAASVLAGARLECLDVLDVREPGRPTISRRDGCDVGPPTVGASTTVPTTTTPSKRTAGTSGTATKGATTTTASGGAG